MGVDRYILTYKYLALVHYLSMCIVVISMYMYIDIHEHGVVDGCILVA